MEQLSVPILQRFDTIASIMPYYGPTHKAFLLMSSLCSASRRKLDEHYVAFINWMEKHCISIFINLQRSYDLLFFPNDLFEVNFDWVAQIHINKFIRFIRNLHERKGCYFNNNYAQIPNWINIKITTKSLYKICSLFITLDKKNFYFINIMLISFFFLQ